MPALPPIALTCFVLLAAACSFNSDDRGGHFLCSDGVCPSGEHCVAGACTTATTSDAPELDGMSIAALTCADPGMLAADTGAGSTVGRTSRVSAACSSEIMNGPDAVYRVAVAAGDHLHISITGDYAVAAYALAPCDAAPATPTCEGELAAFAGAPIVAIAPSTGDQFVVVDSVLPLGGGTYTLTVTVD